MNRTVMEVMRGPTLKGEIPTIVGVMPVETLVRHHFVPRRDTLRDVGYQRMPTSTRVNQLASALRKQEVDLPTSVLLSMRGIEFEDVLERMGPDIYTFRLDPQESDSRHRLFVVDGQHRIAALEKALQDGDAGLRAVKIPFVCMIGADESWEMRQFHVVNSNAKSVRTDFALDLLKARYKRDPAFAAWVEDSTEAWKIHAQSLTERLATASRSWKGKIRLPNAPKADTTVPSASFVISLRALLTQPTLFRRVKDIDQQGQIIDAYWSAIRRVLPGAFEKPAAYNIQKGVGVAVMHSVFPSMLDQARYQGESLFAPESYVELLDEALSSLEGLNGAAQTVSGADFWRTGRAGAAGAYTSAAGKRRLAQMIEARLPDLEI